MNILTVVLFAITFYTLVHGLVIIFTTEATLQPKVIGLIAVSIPWAIVIGQCCVLIAAK